jgi:RNA polymerase sigma-70 factor (ECF subfamily)
MVVEASTETAGSDTDVTGEHELLRRVASGERRAFEAIMRRYNQRLYRVARAIVGDDSEAEDAVQAAYLAAFVAVPQFAGRSSVGTWLTRITINEASARRRALVRRRSLDNLALSEEVVAKRERTPEEIVSMQQLVKRVESAVDGLPASYRLVLVLSQVQGLSGEETAESLGLTVDAVRVRLHRARALLREQLHAISGARLEVELFEFAGQRCDRIVAGALARIERGDDTLPGSRK